MPASASAHERREPGADSVLGAALGSAALFATRLLLPLLFPLAIVSPFPLLVLRLHGTEIERPLAIVMIGGLVTSTLFTLLALPTFYELVHRLQARWYRKADA